jgi:hypothetical protein
MPKNLGNLLLAAFLIVFGVSLVVTLSFLHYIVAGLAIAAGVVMLMNKPI